MTIDLEHRAEIQRLARVLTADPSELAFLDGAVPADLRALRGALADELFERHRRSFERAVALADRLPGPLTAKLAQHAMGAVLGARAASLLSPEKAADLARRLPPPFLADVAENIDLRRVGPLLAGIPVPTLQATAAELRRREQWVVLGMFVGHIETTVLERLLEVLDGEALLRTALVVERPEHIDGILAVLDDPRIDEVLEAAHRHDLWSEAVWLLSQLSAPQRERIIAAIERLQADALDRLAELLLAEAELRAAAEPLIELAPQHLRERIGA